jgi:hypothetical protein
MTTKRVALAILVSMLALAGCSAGGHVAVGERNSPAPNAQYGLPG